ncbi:MAG: DALR domain-containing protein, partial [Thermoplasmata archaeon]
FNTREAIAVLFELVSALNEKLEKLDMNSLALALHFFDEVSGILGIEFEKEGNADKFVELLVELRAEARKRKDWATADKIRESLRNLGVEIEDTADGTKWKYV